MPDCIQEPELSKFVQGKLPESRAEQISSHIDDCEVCQDTVVAMSAEDTFVENLRDPVDDAPEANEPQELGFRHGLQRLLNGMQLVSPAVADSASFPRQIGPYVIESKLGDGGMGTVFRAQHSKLKRTVALKVLPSHRWSNAQAIARFEREMEAIGQLDHPHIVRASDAGEDNGMHYLVMEFVDGLDLARLVKRLGRLPVADACELARQAAIGLQNAHESGLVHRDVKPSNLMLAWDRGNGNSGNTPSLKILDLGLALLGDEHLREEHDVTTVGALMGTLDYMSPEQGIDSHSVDHRADIYGLGATLFKLLTGRAPYADPQYSTLMKKMTALATKAAPSLGKIRPDLPASVVQVVDKMLARDPDERYASAREVAEALNASSKSANLESLLRTGLDARDPDIENAPTQPQLNRKHQSATQQPTVASSGRAGQGGGWKRWLVAAMMGGAIFAAGAVYRIATDYGDIIVWSQSGDDLEVAVKQQGEEVDRIQVKAGQGKTRVRSGNYEIEVIGKDAELVIQPKGVQVSRSTQTLIPIRAKPVESNTARPASSELGVAPKLVELGLGKVSPDIAVGGVYQHRLVIKNVSEQTQVIRVRVNRWTTGLEPVASPVTFLPSNVVAERGVQLGGGESQHVDFFFAVKKPGPQNFEVMADVPGENTVPERGVVALYATEVTVPDFTNTIVQADKPLYRVQAGDVLGVHIPGILGKNNEPPPTHHDANGDPVYFGYPIQIREDGTITLPYINARQVAGLSIREIEEDLLKAYTKEKEILRAGEAVILVSIAKKASERTVNRSGADSTAPRYDGRTLHEWLNEVEFERSPDRLAAALEAVEAMISHPQNKPLVNDALDAVFALMRQSGKHPMFTDKFSEQAWLTFHKMPVENVARRIVKEVSEGTGKSRQFLSYVWEPSYGHVSVFTTENEKFEKELRQAVTQRSNDVLPGLGKVAQTDRDWCASFAFQLTTQPTYKAGDAKMLTEVFSNGLASEDPMVVAKCVRQLALIAPDLPAVAERTKELLRSANKPVVANPRVLFLALQAAETLGPELQALEELKDVLSSQALIREHHYQYTGFGSSEPLPMWKDYAWQQGGGGFGGGFGGGAAIPVGNGNLLPIVLRILPAYGDDAVTALPQLIGFFAQLDHARRADPELRKLMLTLDPTLDDSVLWLLCKDGKYTGVNVFGDIREPKGDTNDKGRIPTRFCPDVKTVEELNTAGTYHDLVMPSIAAAIRRLPALKDFRLTIEEPESSHLPITLRSLQIEIRWPLGVWTVHPRMIEACSKEIAKQLPLRDENSKGEFVIDLIPTADEVSARIEKLQMQSQGMGGGGMGGGMF